MIKKKNLNIYKMIFIYILLNSIIPNLSSNNSFDFKEEYSFIKLKVVGEGYNNIFSYKFYKKYYPNEVIINGDMQNNINSRYYFNLTVNEVILSWNNSINNCDYLFFGCSNITEIDLSHFNTSRVTSMQGMFYNCSSLIYLNISNLDTSIVIQMKFIFKGCLSLISLDLSNFETSNLENMASMFESCSSLKYLDISKFDTSKVSDMNSMFRYCNSITSLDLSNFDTSSVINMENMFGSCSSLTSLDLTNFNTSSVINMENMFGSCSSLNSLDLSNFNTSLVSNMKNMFFNCNSLISLNLSNFRTEQVKNMEYMFFNCNTLTSLNLSNFRTSQVTNMEYMFSGCSKLIYIDLANFEIKSTSKTENTFGGIPDNAVICIKDENNAIINQIKNQKSYNINCSLYIDNFNNYCDIKNNYYCKPICRKEEPFLYERKNCIDDCNINDIEKEICILHYDFSNVTHVYENENFMLRYILNYIKNNFNISKSYINIVEGKANFTITKIENNNTKSIRRLYNNNNTYYALIINILQSKEEEFPKKVFDIFKLVDNNKLQRIDIIPDDITFNSTKIINCNEYSIESLIIDSCISCKDGYELYKDSNNSFGICTKKCEGKFIFETNECIEDCSKSSINKYEYNNICYTECPKDTIEKRPLYCELSCPPERPYEAIITKECVTDCTINDIVNNICKKNYMGKETNNSNYKNLDGIILKELFSGNLNSTIEKAYNDKNGVVFSDESTIRQISAVKNLIYNADLPSINFSQCQELLKNEFGINEEELMIYMVQNKVEGLKIPIIDYILFSKNGNKNINLSVCNNVTVQYEIPADIGEDQDKYDPNSDYYNDECNIGSSNDNVDMTLFEKKNYYNNNNMSLCESNCAYKGYNSTTSKALCDCNIKNDITYSSDDNNNLLNKLENDKSSSNLGVTKCLNVITYEKIKSNSGFLTIAIILGIFIIVFILFCIKGKNSIEHKIDDTIYKKFEKEDKKQKIGKPIKRKNSIKAKNSKSFKMKKQSIKKIFTKKSKVLDKSSSRKYIAKNKNLLTFQKNEVIINNVDIIENKPDFENDYEMNTLSYEDALKYDKRACCDYYCSLIKNKQIIAFTFCSFNDYNSGIIKKFMLFLSFALHFTINALFFNDSNMHQIYEDQGKYNFTYQLPYILISALTSTIILRVMLQGLVLSDKSVLKVKFQPTKNLAINMKYQILKCINIKLAIFFILNFILLILFGFYLTCLTGRYQNTQIHIIENTAISFGFSLFYPFIINIFPSFIRTLSLDNKSNNKSCLYNTSKFLQLL